MIAHLFATNTEFYTTHSLSTTGVETHVPQSSFISPNLDTSTQTSLLANNSSVSMDLMSNNTAVTVSDNTAGSFESASITAGISATAFDSATSNVGSINSLITHSSIVTSPLFYATDKFSATEVETALLYSGIISSDFVTSMQASLLAKNSSVSMDLISNNTAVTVDDTTAASTEDASTTTAIFTTAFDSATSNTASIDSMIIHSFIATTPLCYATDKLSATEVETAQLQSGIISSDFVTSVAASSFAENVSVPTNFMNNKTAVIVSDTTTESLKSNMLSITYLSPSFVLQLSVYSQSTVRPQSILDPSPSDLISSSVQDLRSVSSSISTHPTTPNGNYGKATSQIQSAFSSPELISSSVQDFQCVSSNIDTYLTTPNRNNEQVTTPIQSAFSENFIIISASVAGVIIIVFGPVLVEQVTRTKTTQII